MIPPYCEFRIHSLAASYYGAVHIVLRRECYTPSRWDVSSYLRETQGFRQQLETVYGDQIEDSCARRFSICL